MDAQTAQLLALVATVVALAAGYAKAFHVHQFQIVEWVIDAGRVPGRFRGLVNLVVGVAIAAAFSGLGAWQAEESALLALGLLAGVLASVEAAKLHDARDAGAVSEARPAATERTDWPPAES